MNQPTTRETWSPSDGKTVSGHIALRLNPAELSNPDADIRCRLPELVSERTLGQIVDDGYDYTEEGTLIVFLACDSLNRDVQTVIRILADNTVCENQLLDSAVIGVSTDGETFDIVHPADKHGQFTAAPW